MILIKDQILVFEKHFAHLAKGGERSARTILVVREGGRLVVFAP